MNLPSEENREPRLDMTNIRRLDATWSLTDEEAELLFTLAKEARENIVEIGAFKGRSTCILALGAEAGNKPTIHTVDIFQFSEQQDVERNLELAGIKYPVHILKMSSLDAAKFYEGKDLGLLFIDADHSYEAVKQDFLAWEKHIPVGGVVLFHDYNNSGWPGVKLAVDEIVSQGGWMPIQTKGWLAFTWRI